MYLKDLDKTRMAYPKLKRLVESQLSAGVVTFSDLKSTVPNSDQIKDYGFVSDTYSYDFSVQEVFNTYRDANPSDAWSSGGLIDFGFAIDKHTNQVYYPGDAYPGAKVGQVLYLHCTILGLKTLCMAHEIVKVDDTEKEIIFSYTEGGMTAGNQTITFEELGPGKTQVTHTSTFKGVSKFRDKFYAFFHSLIVGKFHANLKGSLEKNYS